MVAISTIEAATPSQMQSHSLYPRGVFGSKWSREPIPKYDMPEDEMPPNAAYQFIKEELELDGRPALNLATFVTTFMEDEAIKLMLENMNKNMIDYEEYPMTAELQNRVVNMIGRLFNAPLSDHQPAIGVSTVGSSEAIILSTLAMKRRWQLKRKADGKPTDKPNLVMGSNVQVCWEKAVKYLEIEPRYVFCSESQMFMDPKKAIELVDEHTIGCVAILGSTYTGHYEDAKTLNDLLEPINRKNGWNIPIHVDAASGGFVAPFIAPDLEWDFRLPLVGSINVSGHKYGLVLPGVGWALWKSKEYLPEDLVFHVNYLGSDQATFTLNFSKGASQVIAQYYVMIRLGKAGFTAIMENLQETAVFLSQQLKSMGFEILSSEDPRKGLPVIAFRFHKGHRFFDEFDVAARLRERGWIVPAYSLAPHAEKIKLLRVVVREDFSRNRAELLLNDMHSTLDFMKSHDEKAMETRRNAIKTWGVALSRVKNSMPQTLEALIAASNGKAGDKAHGDKGGPEPQTKPASQAAPASPPSPQPSSDKIAWHEASPAELIHHVVNLKTTGPC